MRKGWLFDGGKWYYLNSSGIMETGSINVDGKQYYMLPDDSLFNGENISQDNASQENSKTIEMNSQEFNNLYRKYFEEYINNYRESLGLSRFTASSDLEKSSLWKSKHMGENSYFSHDYNGVKWNDLVSTNTGINISAEILYSGYGGYDSVDTKFNEEVIRNLAQKSFNIWKNSPGHNAIMTGNYKSFGASYFIGSKGGYATGHFS